MIKKNIFLRSLICLILLSTIGACNNTKKVEVTETIEDKPLNITILLDLSDRLTMNSDPVQKERDIDIVNYISKKFKNKTIENGKLVQSNNKIKVMFYPTPESEDISVISRNLNIDLAKKRPADKKKSLMEMDSLFSKGLNTIYDKTLEQKKWTGSDIWGFFSDKKIDNYCIQENYQNIVVILTDGYLYDVHNKQNKGNRYSYLLPKNLDDKNSLIVERNDLSNVKVLMLEINPKDPKKLGTMKKILGKWLTEMGLSPEDFCISETAMSSSTEIIIDNFFGF